MASSIVAESTSVKPYPESIARLEGSYFDAFEGTVVALVDAGLIAAHDLIPQAGRAPGCTAFLPSGEPCPPRKGVWRSPGYRTIRQREDGTIRLEITVSKQVQAARRAKLREQQHEAEQVRINRDIEERGHLFAGWQLKQNVGSRGETWEGTKAQLQAAGLGADVQYPGEPGAKQSIVCRCPLGAEFRIHLPSWDRAKAAAGIYQAVSDFAQGETAEDRRQLRRAFGEPAKSSAAFRAECADFAELVIGFVWREVFCRTDGALRFDLPEGGATYASLGEAFQAVRDAVKHAPIVSDAKLQAALKAKVAAASARNDSALQALLREAMKPPLAEPSSDAR